MKTKTKTLKKINRFYKRERKGFKFSSYSQVQLTDVGFINHKISEAEKNLIWMRDIKVQIGRDMDDFARNLHTLYVAYTYPKNINHAR